LDKRIKVSGYIDLPAGQDIPPMGARIYGSFVAEVDGDHRDRRKRKGGEQKIVQTAPATMTDESTLDRILPPGDPNQASLEEQDAETPKRRRRPRKEPETPAPVAEDEHEPEPEPEADDAKVGV